MTGYDFHPEAFADLDDMRAYIAQEDSDAAGRIRSEILDAENSCRPRETLGFNAQLAHNFRPGLHLCRRASCDDWIARE